MEKTKRSAQKLIVSMFIFGTIGVVRRFIPMASATIAVARGLVGAAFLLLLTFAMKKRPDRAAIRGNLALLLISGVVMGVNWIALFEAYNFTSVAVATLCYYMAPVFVILLSAPVLGEKLTARKLLCVGAALVGMVLVSGVLDGNAYGSLAGVLLGLLAAVLYAGVILLNKKMKPMPGLDRSIIQLAAAGVILLPYALLTGGGGEVTPMALALLAVVCIVHTGLAYALYFGSMEGLPAHTIALLSYIDPVVAVLLSTVLLREPLTVWTVLGAVLILGAAAVAELNAEQE